MNARKESTTESPIEQLLLTPDEVMRVTRLGRSKLWELMMTRNIPSVLIGKSRRIPAEGLRRWVESLAEQGAA